jgi:hypothetical protein
VCALSIALLAAKTRGLYRRGNYTSVGQPAPATTHLVTCSALAATTARRASTACSPTRRSCRRSTSSSCTSVRTHACTHHNGERLRRASVPDPDVAGMGDDPEGLVSFTASKGIVVQVGRHAVIVVISRLCGNSTMARTGVQPARRRQARDRRRPHVDGPEVLEECSAGVRTRVCM